MNTRLLTIFTTLAFLGFSGLVAAHPCANDPDNPKHKHCSTELPIVYTAELISGAFKSNIYGSPQGSDNVAVTLNSRGNELVSNVRLDMNRDVGDSPDTWNQAKNGPDTLFKFVSGPLLSQLAERKKPETRLFILSAT